MTENYPHRSPGNPKSSFVKRVIELYTGGFREMTVGKRLWVLILVKLAILFLVFRLFFFPDRLAEEYDNDDERARAVARELTDPARALPVSPPSQEK